MTKNTKNKSNQKRRGRPVNIERVQKIKSMRESGMKITNIAALLNCS